MTKAPGATNSPALLVDFGAVPECCTNHALDELHKSLGDRPGTDTIWAPHDDPLISGHIEIVTSRGIEILSAIHASVDPGMLLAKATPWSPDDEALAKIHDRLYLKRVEDYTMRDWLDWIDYSIARYLPDSVIGSEADYLAIRSVFAGGVQAAIKHPITAKVAATLMTLSPAMMTAAVRMAQFTGRVGAVLTFAKQRAADAIVEIGEQTRRRLRAIIVNHEERRALGMTVSHSELQGRFRDEFGYLNRDWRRIAVTEVVRAANEGFIASLPPGSRVRRLEQYQDACPFCQRIHGMEFDVVDPSEEDKDGWTEVWAGKNNLDRSASPRKRVGDVLVERLPSELWWPAAGVQHPHCRGRWVLAESRKAPDGVDQEFHDWLLARIESARKVPHE